MPFFLNRGIFILPCFLAERYAGIPEKKKKENDKHRAIRRESDGAGFREIVEENIMRPVEPRAEALGWFEVRRVKILVEYKREVFTAPSENRTFFEAVYRHFPHNGTVFKRFG